MPAGAPVGNQNGKNGTAFRDAVRWALANYARGDVKRGTALKAIATKAVEQAIEGDKEARREIADRIDGKPAQQIIASGPNGGAINVTLSGPDGGLL